MKTFRMMAAPVLVAALAAGVAGAAPAQNTALSAHVSGGLLQGVRKGDSVAFLGVPFAAPPVGDLRWRPPQPAASWTGVRQAVAFSPSCPQIINPPEGRAPWTPEYLIPGATSEDCLYLNVWRPAKAVHGAPILFWIYGGGGVEGSGSVPAYDGAALARQGVIVVTFNYRLGVLGQLSLAALSQEQGGTSGNYSVEDTIAALRWVKANAAAFGGDPAHITIAGQSAGSGMVNSLTGSPMAKGLFWRTITESGSTWSSNGPAAPATAEAAGQAFADKVGAKSLSDLRAMPADALVKAAASANAHFGSVLDGKVFTKSPVRAQGEGGFNDTPVLSGFNADEDSGFDDDYTHYTVQTLAAKRKSLYGPVADRADKLYPATTDAQANAAATTMMRDRARGAAYEWAKRRAKVTHNPIYIYFYQHPEPGPTQARYGTFHTDEVPYVFQNLNAPRPFTAADRKVSQDVSARWINFINGRAPDAPGKPKWPAYSNDAPKIMHLGDREGPEPVLPADKLRLVDDLVDKTGSISAH